MPRQKTKALATGFGSFVEKNLPPFSRSAWALKMIKRKHWRCVLTYKSEDVCRLHNLHSSGVPAFNCRGIPNCNQPYSFHHKAKSDHLNSSLTEPFIQYPSYFIHERVCHDSSNFLHSFNVQASLSDISAEDFKIAVNSTPLAGKSVMAEKWIYWPTCPKYLLILLKMKFYDQMKFQCFHFMLICRRQCRRPWRCTWCSNASKYNCLVRNNFVS